MTETTRTQQTSEPPAQGADLPFDEMIRARTSAWATAYDNANRGRISEMVAMTKRKRGDYFGYFNQSRNTSQWRTFTGKGMVTFPVIERSVKSKMATAIQTDVRLAIESVRKLPEKEAATEICNSIYQYLNTHLWTNSTEAQINEFGQLGRFCYILSNYSPAGGMAVEVPRVEAKPLKTGITEFVCASCGMDYQPEDLGIDDPADYKQAQNEAQNGLPNNLTNDANATVAERDQDISPVQYLENADITNENHSCPACGGDLHLTALAGFEQILALTGDTDTKETGFPEHRVISPLLTRCDTHNTHGFDYRRAHWFNYHPLIPLYQVLKIAPELKDKIQDQTWSKWSDGARWHYDLSQGSDDLGGNPRRDADYALDELIEVDFWWIVPAACHGWTSPARYERFGYTIEKGETIEQAHLRQFGAFEGLMVAVCGEEVVPLGDQDFKERLVGFPWRKDAQSYFPQGEENLLKPQDAVTNILSMINAYCGRFGNPKLIVNALRFGNAESFAKNYAGQIIYTNSSDPDNADTDWRRDIGFLQPGDLSGAIYQYVQLIIDIAKEMSGVFNETVGNVEQKAETLGGRTMALNQSLGLMTPTQTAKAQGKVEWVYSMLKLVQRYAPDEAFLLFKGTFDEEWKDEDIAAFRALDIEREIFIRVVEGTDVPRTQLEMEQRFIEALNFGLFNEPNPLPVEIRNHVVKKVLGIDYDVSNYSATKRIADRRYAVIKEELAPFTAPDALTVTSDANGYPVRSLRPEIIASIQQDSRTQVRDTDDHLSMLGYWTDQLNSLVGAKEQNETLIFAVDMQIQTHRAMMAAQAAQAQAAQGVATDAANQVAAVQNQAAAENQMAA